ncbi:hypothetical protein GCM10027446_22320 [Angustibacter peucedani]
MRRVRGAVLLGVLALGAVAAAPAGAVVHEHRSDDGRPAATAGPASGVPRLGVGVPSVLPVAQPEHDPAPASSAPSSTPTSGSTSGSTSGATSGSTSGETLGPPPADVSAVHGGRVLYLTFDDGPDPHWTPQVLALLAKYHARATFFQIGMEVRLHRSTARLVRQAGQAVGNHTSHHKDLTELPLAQLRQEVEQGVPSATCLRPPFGAVDAHVRRIAAEQGQRVVIWSVDTEDWEKPGVATIEHHLLHDARPGRIVLMHDGGGNRSQTVAALRWALPRLAAKGYRFASVPGC